MKPKRPIDLAAVASMIDAGYSCQRIADRLDTSRQYLYTRLRGEISSESWDKMIENGVGRRRQMLDAAKRRTYRRWV